MADCKPFSGTSTKGDFSAALEEAIKAAASSSDTADGQTKWKLKEVTGVKGGLHPSNDITVTIEAEVD